MKFKQWMEASPSPFTRALPPVRDLRTAWGAAAHFDRPISLGDVIPIEKGVSGVAGGIGKAFRQAMYPHGEVPDIVSTSLEFSKLFDTPNFVDITIRAPYNPEKTNLKELSELLKQEILRKRGKRLNYAGAVLDQGRVLKKSFGKNSATLTMRFPKKETTMQKLFNKPHYYHHATF